jgi:hypothetical protein
VRRFIYENTKVKYDNITLNQNHALSILDGLRGVAALMVVAFHIFEAHATSHLDQVINHGYLAVDFFFCYRVLLLAMLTMIDGIKCRQEIF